MPVSAAHRVSSAREAARLATYPRRWRLLRLGVVLQDVAILFTERLGTCVALGQLEALQFTAEELTQQRGQGKVGESTAML